MDNGLRSNNELNEAIVKNEAYYKKTLALKLGIIFILILFHIICSNYREPPHHGFFCNDNTIKYPFKPETIDTQILLKYIIPLPTLIIFLCGEIIKLRQRDKLLNKKMKSSVKLLLFCKNFIKQNINFSLGVLITLNTMNIAKYMLGKLRPHFMAVCQPKILDGSTCQDAINRYRYVEDYHCERNGFTYSHEHYARLSFPSAHAGLTFFMATYLSIYIQRSFNCQTRGRWMKFFIQFLLILMAWFVALTRISDYWHHTIDVVCGAALGILAALYIAAFISRLFKPLDSATAVMPN